MTDTTHNPTSTDSEFFDVNHHVHEVLANHHSIAAIWCVEDVKRVRPHLTDDQACKVLQQVGDHHDAEWGINWTTLETVADDLYPRARRQTGGMTMKPIIVITVQGGLVAEVNATAPVTVFVEDWDCPPDRPLVMDFEPEPLTPAQERRVQERFAELNDQSLDEREQP